MAHILWSTKFASSYATQRPIKREAVRISDSAVFLVANDALAQNTLSRHIKVSLKATISTKADANIVYVFVCFLA